MSALRLTLDEFYCQQGGEFVTHLPLHALYLGEFSLKWRVVGVSDVKLKIFLLETGGAECALIWLSVAYCEGMHFGMV